MTALRVIRRVRSLRYERAPRRRDDDQPFLGQKGNRAPRCSDADAVLLGDLADAGDLLARQPLARADALAQRRANSPVWRFCSAHGADARWLTIIAPGYRAIRIDRMLSMSPGWTQPVGGAMRELAVTGMAPASEQSYLQYVELPPLPALRALTEASRDLLRRSAELPDSEQGLLSVLAEYRYAVYALVAISDRLCP